MNFREFFAAKPDLRYIFFGGKGGVGKTTISVATAYWIANELKKDVLLLSINPIHSLSHILDQDLKGKGICKVKEVDRMYAVEIEMSDVARIRKQKLKERVMMYVQDRGE